MATCSWISINTSANKASICYQGGKEEVWGFSMLTSLFSLTMPSKYSQHYKRGENCLCAAKPLAKYDHGFMLQYLLVSNIFNPKIISADLNKAQKYLCRKRHHSPLIWSWFSFWASSYPCISLPEKQNKFSNKCVDHKKIQVINICQTLTRWPWTLIFANSTCLVDSNRAKAVVVTLIW